jgi:hypothetical protein
MQSQPCFNGNSSVEQKNGTLGGRTIMNKLIGAIAIAAFSMTATAVFAMRPALIRSRVAACSS